MSIFASQKLLVYTKQYNIFYTESQEYFTLFSVKYEKATATMYIAAVAQYLQFIQSQH